MDILLRFQKAVPPTDILPFLSHREHLLLLQEILLQVLR